jgi:S1-C subfamily serine protease
MSFLDEVGESIERVAAAAGPAVVRLGGGWRGGSGVVIDNGFVLTNAHNVRSDEIHAVFDDGRRAAARVAGIDIDGDLCVLAVDTGEAAALEWAADVPGLGRPVLAAARNGAGLRVTFGTISSVAQAFRGPRGRRISGSLEHTAPLAPGSSGSPLLDGEGRLVGLNTNRLGGGFYLALPADESLRERVAALKRGDSVERPRLGVGIAPPFAARQLRRAVGLPELDGVLVRTVEEDTPAERAAIQEGDLIVEAGGNALRGPDDLYDALSALKPGAKLQLRIIRGAEERSVEVSFGADRDADGSNSTGPVH